MSEEAEVPQEEAKDVGGRPTLFRPEYVEQARKLAEMGATDLEMAEFFDIGRSTFYTWRHNHPEFAEAVKAGKFHADERVVRSLYQQATGFAYTEKQAVKLRNADGSERVEVVEVEKYQPPDTKAQVYWTKNRRKDEWKDQAERVHSGTVKHEQVTPDEARMQLERFMRGEAEKAGEGAPTTH